MDTAKIEITKEEAALIPLLRKIPVVLGGGAPVTLEHAESIVKARMLVDGLIKKVNEAFAPQEEVKE